MKVRDKCEDYYKAVLEHSVAVQVNSDKKILLTARKKFVFCGHQSYKNTDIKTCIPGELYVSLLLTISI